MSKAIISLAICISSLFIVDVNILNATTGKLKQDSICYDSSGTAYGQHGDGHWHYARSTENGWYMNGAEGGLGYTSPCTSGQTYNPPVYNPPVYTPPPVYVNQVPQIYSIDTVRVADTQLNGVVGNDAYINSIFNISADDVEDGVLTNSITLNYDKKNLMKIGTHDITLTLKDKNAQSITKTVKFEVFQNNLPSITKSKNLIMYEGFTVDDVIEGNVIVINDAEDGNIVLTSDKVKIDSKSKKITITVKDSLNGVKKSVFSYKELKNEPEIKVLKKLEFISDPTKSHLVKNNYFVAKDKYGNNMDISMKDIKVNSKNNIVKITVVDNDGNSKTIKKEYEIVDNLSPEIENNRKLEFRNNPTDKDIIKGSYFNISDFEDGNIELKKDAVKIDKAKNKVSIEIIDDNGLKTTKSFKYKIVDNVSPTISADDSIIFCENWDVNKLISKEYIKAYDYEDGEIALVPENIVVDEINEKITVFVTDNDGMSSSIIIKYERCKVKQKMS